MWGILREAGSGAAFSSTGRSEFMLDWYRKKSFLALVEIDPRNGAILKPAVNGSTLC